MHMQSTMRAVLSIFSRCNVRVQDTFLDAQHVKDSFPGHSLRFLDPQGQADEAPRCPFRVTFPAPPKPHTEGQKGVKRKRGEAAEAEEAAVPEAAPAAASSKAGGLLTMVVAQLRVPPVGPFEHLLQTSLYLLKARRQPDISTSWLRLSPMRECLVQLL